MVAVVALLAAACSQDTANIQQAPLLRFFEPASGRIAYMGVDGNIYTINQRGTQQTAVTADAALPSDGRGLLRYYQFPIWSPAGKRLAFVRIQGIDQVPTSTSVVTTDPDGTAATEAFTSGEALPSYLYWSPDGSHLSFITNSGTGAASSLQLVPAGGGEATVIDAGSPFYWCWTPDGRTILIHAGGGFSSRSRIAFVNVFGYIYEEGLALRPGPFQTPGCSPRGDRILVAAQTGGDNDLIMTSRKGDVWEVLGRANNLLTFSWAPDGHQVAYVARNVGEEGVEGNLTLIDINEPNGEPRTVTEESLVIAFFWSPDSRKIAYFVPGAISDPEDEEAEPTIVLTLFMHNVRKEQTREVLTFIPTQQFMDVVQNFDQYYHSARIWSPDSRHLVFAGQTQDGPAILLAKADSTIRPRIVTPGMVAFWSWR